MSYRRYDRYGRDWPEYEKRSPLPVADGLRAQSHRGEIGQSWWSGRFKAAIERTGIATRLSRGKEYARSGQVLPPVNVAPGRVSARVQGSRPTPYAVTIEVRPLDEAAWTAVEAAMAARGVFLARLLSGEMPDEIEEAFAAAGVSLFPTLARDLATSCSCPDSANPCKHIMAVYYLLAEDFDSDPFLMFRWRGRDRDRLLAELRALRAAASPAKPERPATVVESAPDGPETLARFWEGEPALAEIHLVARPTGAPDALLREIDPRAGATLGSEVPDGLRPLYAALARDARRRLAPADGEPGPAPRGRTSALS